jgi:hypothetical protein
VGNHRSDFIGVSAVWRAQYRKMVWAITSGLSSNPLSERPITLLGKGKTLNLHTDGCFPFKRKIMMMFVRVFRAKSFSNSRNRTGFFQPL